MISLGFVTDPAFIERYCDETEFFVLPIALEVDYNIYQELIGLVISRRRYLEESGYIDRKKREQQGKPCRGHRPFSLSGCLWRRPDDSAALCSTRIPYR